jgi:hypothetical protein
MQYGPIGEWTLLRMWFPVKLLRKIRGTCRSPDVTTSVFVSSDLAEDGVCFKKNAE